MSSKYPVLPPNKIIHTMKKFGCKKTSQRGSHAKFINYKTRKIFIIPMHYEIAKGTLKSILEQAEVELEEFFKKIVIN